MHLKTLLLLGALVISSIVKGVPRIVPYVQDEDALINANSDYTKKWKNYNLSPDTRVRKSIDEATLDAREVSPSSLLQQHGGEVNDNDQRNIQVLGKTNGVQERFDIPVSPAVKESDPIIKLSYADIPFYYKIVFSLPIFLTMIIMLCCCWGG